MKIKVSYEEKTLILNDAVMNIGNSGIVTLHSGIETTVFNFRRITTAEGIIIHCYNSTDYAVAEDFSKRI